MGTYVLRRRWVVRRRKELGREWKGKEECAYPTGICDGEEGGDWIERLAGQDTDWLGFQEEEKGAVLVYLFPLKVFFVESAGIHIHTHNVRGRKMHIPPSSSSFFVSCYC